MLTLWRIVLVVFLLSNSWLAHRALAAEQTRPIKIGVLNNSWGPTPATVGLRDRLQELGYRENEDFVIGVRFTQGDLNALPAAARELVQYDVDVIFAVSGYAAQATQQATTQIPIVSAFTGANPVALGLVASFARPGGNLTGVTELENELGPKRLELFREIVPSLKRVLFLYEAADVANQALAQAYRDAAQRLRIELVAKAVQTEEEVQATLSQIQQDVRVGILVPYSLSLNIPGSILAAASQRALPTMFVTSFLVMERGGLASYGPDLYESGRMAARLVDKIIKGTDPAEIPIEVNPKMMFTINLKVAKTLVLTIAPEVLYRADRIIR